jgi:hypothetical protein
MHQKIAAVAHQMSASHGSYTPYTPSAHCPSNLNMEEYLSAFVSVCVPNTVQFPDSTIQRKPAMTCWQCFIALSSSYSTFRLDVDALLFAHCSTQPMHTMGECVSAYLYPIDIIGTVLPVSLHYYMSHT